MLASQTRGRNFTAERVPGSLGLRLVSMLLLQADEVSVGVGDDELVDLNVGAAGPVDLRFSTDYEGSVRAKKTLVRSVEGGVAGR